MHTYITNVTSPHKPAFHVLLRPSIAGGHVFRNIAPAQHQANTPAKNKYQAASLILQKNNKSGLSNRENSLDRFEQISLPQKTLFMFYTITFHRSVAFHQGDDPHSYGGIGFLFLLRLQETVNKFLYMAECIHITCVKM